ncbi:hypothetical protein AB0G74_21685 [Streptomyces sp. NPDC020875]|uniref:hypothetical protein n=1 Tax=Streptomyces sp. NPDC020875 TaxID=3154898 RepID=UPI0033D76AA0
MFGVRHPRVGSGRGRIELADELIALETAAWTEIRDGRLTVDTAAAVQVAVTAHAQATGQQRYAVELVLKARDRRPADA